MMTFDTPDSIDTFRLIALKHALRLKVKGFNMHRGISLIRAAKGYGFKGRTHKQALAFIEELIEVEG